MPLSYLAHPNISPTIPPGSILKPWALLQQLRPISLTAIKRRLGDYQRLAQVVHLLIEIAPAEVDLNENLSGIMWEDVLKHLIKLAEQNDWFPIDWTIFNATWAYHFKAEDKNDGELTKFLHYMPVKFYGPPQFSLYPPLEFIRVLLSNNQSEVIPIDISLNLENYNSGENIWSEAARSAAQKQILQIEAYPDRYPEPVQWLPRLAQWVNRSTGNVILDHYMETTDLDLLPFTWREDLTNVKQAWKLAKPLVNVQKRLMAWYNEDNSRLVDLCDFMIRGENGDRLNW